MPLCKHANRRLRAVNKPLFAVYPCYPYYKEREIMTYCVRKYVRISPTCLLLDGYKCMKLTKIHESERTRGLGDKEKQKN